MTVTRPYRGISAEDRRADRRDRLIDGLLDVVLAEGTLSVTVDKVCTAAGLTKRYFYESFADLDELLLGAADQLFERLYSAMAGAASTTPDEDRIRAVVATVVGELDADPRGARLYTECPGHPVLRARRNEAIATFTRFVCDQLLPPSPTSDLRELKARVLVAGATDLITGHLDGTIAATAAAVVDSVADLATTL